METVKVYQIGVGSFGRYGFEKFVDMHNHLQEVDVELAGVCDKDFERLENAESFAEANDVEVETFRDTDEMYDHAAQQDERVLVYDASNSATHATHIYGSLQRNFFHIAERPPSLSREQHIQEKKLAEDQDVMWKVDFIERESPVVQKALELVEGKRIDSLKAFRESTAGVQKSLNPAKFSGVEGGDILDKMINEVYFLDLLEASGNESMLEVDDVKSFFMPKGVDSDSMMSLKGSKTREIDEAATARTHARVSAGDTDVELYSSWLGICNNAREVEKEHGLGLFNEDYRKVDETAFSDEECRFFVVEGEVSLIGDLLHGRLYNIDEGEEIDVPDLLHDQLYRVLKKSVLNAAGERSDPVSERETEEFMELLFDIRDEAVEGAGDYFDELDESQSIMRQKVVEDKKILDAEKSSTIAG
ncbi:Gfo/Idh/MocA family oxidoreductase [Candidatus Nanohalovita haloferacivicina]|uniref:Gfo/Idh/MocA family oxidoreductase n=1 Tax=Candidatus Nanohalovita haloferacivicina TaxID=2978046 RepID=UPI00325FC682